MFFEVIPQVFTTVFFFKWKTSIYYQKNKNGPVDLRQANLKCSFLFKWFILLDKEWIHFWQSDQQVLLAKKISTYGELWLQYLLGLSNAQPWRQRLCVLQQCAEQLRDVAKALKIFQKTTLCFHHCLNACLLVFILEEYARIGLFMLVGSSKCLHRPTQCRPIHVQKYHLWCNASLFLGSYNNWIKWLV